MAGVVRPYTLVDVLGTLNSQSTGSATPSTTVSGVGFFAEADESSTSTDTASTQVGPLIGWDQQNWGAFSWQ
jgi:hypothetical protein